MSYGSSFALLVLWLGLRSPLFAQEPSPADAVVIQQKLDQLNEAVGRLKHGRDDVGPVVDVELFAKAAEWIVRHHEFFEPHFSSWTIEALDLGLRRASELGAGKSSWLPRTGSTVLGYRSEVDGSVQPYAVTFPHGYDPTANRWWPLRVELHGRNAKLNEVNFIHQHEGQALKNELAWIQLDVFGRTNNAYRWAGESDVFEALAALKQRVKIDENRIVLSGFSMGGAGAWHLGLHHPSRWSAVGAGAGFVDTVHHLHLTAPLSPLHQKLTRIYDAQDYALNAFNVPTIGYGGELDPQLFAAKTMHAKGQELGVPIDLLVGPGTAHKFHPDSLKQFMTFLATHTRRGRPVFPKPATLKFITYTLKYPQCDWMTIEEQITPYEATVVEADVDASTKTLTVRTKNVAQFQIRRGVADVVVIDGSSPLPLDTAANRSPGISYGKGAEGWSRLDTAESGRAASAETSNEALHKRHDLQGPIDDAFMQPFVCVLPTGTAWSPQQAAWAKWTFDRFEREFDRRLRGRIPVVNDTDVTDDLLKNKHLVLFGDPGSNVFLAKLVDQLPIKWSSDRFEVCDQSYDCGEHGLALIYPNPLNPQRYVVVNSGHTFHEADFENSNANLYSRLGDIGVIQFAVRSGGGYDERVLFADVFDARWRFEAK